MTGSVTHTYTYARNTSRINKVSTAWTCSSGGVVSGETGISINGQIQRIITVPNASTALRPSDNYDITLLDENGLDVAQGLLANRDQTNAEVVVPLVGEDTSTSVRISQLVGVQGPLDLTIANAGDEKQGTIIIEWR